MSHRSRNTVYACCLLSTIACGDDSSTADAGLGSTGAALASTGSADDDGGPPGSTFTTAPPAGSDSSSTGEATATPGTDTGSPVPPFECDEPRVGGEVSLIDDFESPYLPEVDGRRGGWFTFHDETGGTLTPAAFTRVVPTDEDAHGGSYSVHAFGGGFSDWGAELGVGLNYDGGDCIYDASAFEGLTFWARGAGSVDVRFATVDTVPIEFGGICTGMCWDDYYEEVELTEEWQQYSMTWDDLAQKGWGTRVDFDPAELLWIHWVDPTGDHVDIWLDDVHFLPVDDPMPGDTGTEGSSSGTGTEGSTGTDAGTDTGTGTSGEGTSSGTGGSSGGAEAESSTGMGTGSTGG